jgi:hypothetical protein
MNDHTAAKLDDLEEALLFLDAGGDVEAWLCRDTGAVHWHSDEVDPLPEDIDDTARYVALPNKHDLGLGKPLALEFTRMQLPDCYEQVRAMFSRRGAYARFRIFWIATTDWMPGTSGRQNRHGRCCVHGARTTESS